MGWGNALKSWTLSEYNYCSTRNLQYWVEDENLEDEKDELTSAYPKKLFTTWPSSSMLILQYWVEDENLEDVNTKDEEDELTSAYPKKLFTTWPSSRYVPKLNSAWNIIIASVLKPQYWRDGETP